MNEIIRGLLEKCNIRIHEIHDSMPRNIIISLLHEQNESPFYIINLGNIITLYNLWITHLPNITPYYAVKCNPNPVILELLLSLGCHFDCASENEIKTILKITNDTNKIIFANPCKMISHIKYACENNVNLMTFDCKEELYKIKETHSSSRLILRIAVDDSNSECKFNSKFGCKLKDIESLFDVIKELSLDLVGFSFHVGSNCKSSDSYYYAIQDIRTAYDKALTHNLHPTIINIGGGFQGKIKNTSNSKPEEFLFIDIARRIREAQFDFFQKEIESNRITFIAEPGRYFAETSHTLALNVIGKKHIMPDTDTDTNTEERFIYYLNDGIYGSFNCIIFDNSIPTIVPLHNKKDSTLFKSKLFGPTCDSVDLISENILLPELNIGEWVYVENFGAYTVAASSSFNGFKTTDYKYVCKCE